MTDTSDTPKTDALDEPVWQHPWNGIVTSQLVERIDAIYKHARTLERELASLRADAARYRWIRDDAPVAEMSINEMIFVDPAKTDAAIDAAMGEK